MLFRSKGRHLRYTKNDHAGAQLCFEQAVALDPSHGPSWVGLADVNVLAAAYGMKPSREAYAAAKTALKTAADLQGESAEALYVEGMIAFGERRWKDSERVLARVTEIEPGTSKRAAGSRFSSAFREGRRTRCWLSSAPGRSIRSRRIRTR